MIYKPHKVNVYEFNEEAKAFYNYVSRDIFNIKVAQLMLEELLEAIKGMRECEDKDMCECEELDNA